MDPPRANMFPSESVRDNPIWSDIYKERHQDNSRSRCKYVLFCLGFVWIVQCYICTYIYIHDICMHVNSWRKNLPVFDTISQIVRILHDLMFLVSIWHSYKVVLELAVVLVVVVGATRSSRSSRRRLIMFFVLVRSPIQARTYVLRETPSWALWPRLKIVLNLYIYMLPYNSLSFVSGSETQQWWDPQLNKAFERPFKVC